MKLASFLKANKMTLAKMGDLLGVSAETVRRYRDGLRYPEPDIMVALRRATKGKVSERDFDDVANRMAERRAERRRKPAAAPVEAAAA